MTIGVYRAFDGADRLLYIGHSVDVEARLRQHEGTFPAWWAYQRRIEVEEFDSLKKAQAAEALAIATEHPRWNVTGRSTDHPDGFATNVGNMPWLASERDVARNVKQLAGQVRALKSKYLKAARELRMYESMAEGISDGTIDFDFAEDIA